MRAFAATFISGRRRAVALLLAMIAVIVSTVVAYSYLGTQQTAIGIARNIRSHAQARFVAETGLDMTMDYLKNDANWRTSRSLGVWASNIAFGPGFYSVRCDDGIDTSGDGVITAPAEGDNDLDDNAGDPVTLTVTGSAGGCSYVLLAAIRPVYQGPVVLFVVGNPSSLTATETSRKALFESWSWQVSLLDDGSSQPQVDTAVSDADVVLVSVAATSVGTKLKAAECGVVNECGTANPSFGFSSSYTSYTNSNNNQLDVVNNSNYITSPYPNATLTVASVGSIQIDSPAGTLAAGLATLGQRVSSTTIALTVMEAGSALYGGGAATDRRVFFPLGRYTTSQMNSDGQQLLRRSMEWASGAAGISAFGFQTRFGSGQGNVGGKQIATQVTLSEAGTLTSITAYIKSTDYRTHSFRYALYGDSSGQPGSRLVQSSVATLTIPTSFKWYKLVVSPTVLNAGTYWLALSFDNSYMKYRYKSSVGATRYNTNNALTGSGFSSSWGSSSSTLVRQFNIYGTYTPTSGDTGALNNGSGAYSYDDVDLR